MRILRTPRPSPAFVVACIALFVAIGGTGYAAITLKRNSVATKHLKKNAVTSRKIKNRTILTRDLAPTTQQALRGQKGNKGDTGEKGEQCLASDPACRGPEGPAGAPATTLYATVDSGLSPTIDRGSGAIGVQRLAIGVYEVRFNRSVRDCSVSATQIDPGQILAYTNRDHQVANFEADEVHLLIQDSAGAPTDLDFHVQVFC